MSDRAFAAPRLSRRLQLILGVGALLWQVSSLCSQERTPGEPFRGRVDAVLTDVVVLDGARRPVMGLTAQDFVLLEDGRPRPILAVSPVVLPVRDTNTSVVSPDTGTTEAPVGVTTNQLPAEGRLVAIMLDRSIPMEGPTVTARKIARAAIDSLGPGDLAAVVHSTGFSNEGVSRGFTADRAVLTAAVNAPFVGLVNPPTMGTGGLVRGAPDLANTGDCLCGLCVLEAIERTANAMAAARTRHKMIVWIGSAIVIQSGRAPTAACPSLRDQRERTLRSLSNANVTFHAVDPSGLQTMARMADAFAGDPSRAGAANLERQADLGVLPAFTGGRTVLNTNQPELAVPRIFDETSSYYLLAFTPTEPADSVRPRRIQVKVDRKDVEVRARASVYTPLATTLPAADPLEDVVGRLLPEPGVPMELALRPSFDASGASQVVAHIRVTGPAGSDADILIAAFDDHAKTVLSRRIALTLPESGKGETTESLPLASGHYEIRVGSRLKAGNTYGSVHGHVEVPRRSLP